MQFLCFLATSHSHPLPTPSGQNQTLVDGAQARLLGGTLWLTTETLGLLMSTLRFKKNYERDLSLDHLAARGGKVPDPTWIEMGGKALAGIATLMAGVNLALSFSNAAMVPYTKPDKEHLRRSEKEDSHEELADWADFALTTSGTLVSLGFLVVTGGYYSKTFGRRSPLKIDATSPPDNPDASEKMFVTREIGVFGGKDFYPLIINAVGIVLSGAGLAATTLAHLKMEKQYHPHPQSSHASRLVNLDSATSEKRGLVDTMLKSPNLPKAIELLAGTVSLTSIPITFENVMAIAACELVLGAALNPRLLSRYMEDKGHASSAPRQEEGPIPLSAREWLTPMEIVNHIVLPSLVTASVTVPMSILLPPVIHGFQEHQKKPKAQEGHKFSIGT
ncbi:hypothetical protein OC861_000886 [Tilletia horrida]|nr:hypothetical protein OC861_000886 [Tilletia horrida]